MPGQVRNAEFVEDGASAHVAAELQKIGKDGTVEQHGVGAAFFEDERSEERRQVAGVGFRQRADDFDGNLRLVGEEEYA